MMYVMAVEIDDSLLDGDDSIENACRILNEVSDRGAEGTVPPIARPLSEIVAC